MVFVGTYEHTIDGKNRFAVPKDIRAILGATTTRAKGPKPDNEPTIFLYVTRGEGQSLSLYTEENFQQLADDLYESDLDPNQLLEYERVFFSFSRRVEIDKQGRVRLPDHLLNAAGIEKEIVLIGAADHLEIRNRTQWTEYADEVVKEANYFANPRRFKAKRKAAQS